MFETGVVLANKLILLQDRRHNKDIFSSFSNMKICCVFSFELPLRGNSNEYTQHIIINIKRKSPDIIPNTIMSAAMGVFVRSNSHGKQAISV